MRALRAAVGATCVALVVGGVLLQCAAHRRTLRIERDYGALTACLLGGPLAPAETVRGRLLALEASLAMPDGEGATALERGWPASCQPRADALSRSLITGVPSSPSARAIALIGALDVPIVPRRDNPCDSQPCIVVRDTLPRYVEPLAESPGAQLLLAWWQKVEAEAGAAGFVVRDDGSFERPRVRSPALKGPFPEPTRVPALGVALLSRSGPDARGTERSILLRTFASGDFELRPVTSEQRLEVVSADDDAASLLRRGVGHAGMLSDERGILVWPRPVRQVDAHATRTGAVIVVCPMNRECRLVERALRGDAYVTVREQRLPRSQEAALVGGVLVIQEDYPRPVRLAPPNDPFGDTELLRWPVPSIDGAQACRYANRTTLLFRGSGKATLAVHDGHAWSRPVQADLVSGQHGQSPSFSCDAAGASFVVVDRQRRVCATRCFIESCATSCSEPMSERWSHASWVGIGDRVFGLTAELDLEGYRSRDSLWYRLGTVEQMGEATLLVGDEAHDGFFGRTAHAWSVQGGALAMLAGERGQTRFVRVDEAGSFSFVKPR